VKTAQFWFDPICPWTYVTYQWLTQVREVRGIQITPRLLSLYYLNQGRGDWPHADGHRASLNLERFLAFVRQEQGDAVMEQAYQLLGNGLFIDGAVANSELVAQTARTLGFEEKPAVEASQDTSWDQVILADHEAAMGLVGSDVGSPVIALEGGPAFFGPVLSRAPQGADAGRVWDGCQLLASHPDFFELKRTRTPDVKISFT
jgi:2-hydroxychromene-2-carboxylate isomerase